MNVFELLGTIAIRNNEANAALKDTTQKAERAGKEIREAFNKIGSATVKAGKMVGGAAAAVATGWSAAVESTRGYRTEMAKLDAAFVSNGHSSETATKTYKGLQAVLGETDQAVEAANHLAMMCDSEEDLATWTDICTGVYATFGASLPIEGLTEAANETAKTGVVTGSLADALNWAGISEEDFNMRLKACRTEQERQQLIMNTLNGTYKESGERYKENAANIMKANEANENLTRAMSRLGAIGEPILTGIKNWIADMINASVPHLETLITKFGEIDSVWNDVIWPLVQSAFKITFNVDVPDWATIEGTVNVWWTGTAIPALNRIIRVPFDMIPPTWSEIPAEISTWWTKTAKPKIEEIASAVMNLSIPDLSVFINSFSIDWEKMVAPVLIGLLTGNYLQIIPVIGTALAGLIASNWDTHIKPVLDEFLNQVLEIELPDWTQLKNDIISNLKEFITPEMKESIQDIGESLTNAFGIGAEAVASVFTGLKDFGQWCVDNKDTVNEFFGILTNRALGDASGAASFLELVATSIKGLAELGVELVTDQLKWMADNGEKTADAIEAVAAAFMAAAVAAHPYAAAVLAIVGALGYLTAQSNKVVRGEVLQQFTQEELDILQNYVNALREYEAADKALFDGVYQEGEQQRLAAAEKALREAEAQVNSVEGLMQAWSDFQSFNSAGDGIYLDIPAKLAEGTETGIQAELGGMSFEAIVKMLPDWSEVKSNAASLFGGSTSGAFGSHASGLDYVPSDGYYARLHKGEAILNRTEADVWRGGSSGKVESLLAQLVANTAGGQTIILDSGAMVGHMARQMDSRLGTISNRKGRGN